MPNGNSRMLIAGPSGSGKTNTLMHILMKPLAYYDKLYLYAKNLEQGKYYYLTKTFDEISKRVDCDVLECSNDNIIPVSEIDSESQKVVIFDDFVCEKSKLH